MKLRKTAVTIIFILVASLYIFAETSLAQYNLSQALLKYNENNYAAAKTLAQKAFQYDYSLPEYYYIMNLITEKSELTLHEIIKNAQSINTFIKSNFIVSELTLLRHVVNNVYDIKDLNLAYNKILTYKQPQDYIQYIDLLLRTEKYEQALKFIDQIKNQVNDMQIQADELYAKIKLGSYDFRNFTKDIITLKSNNYNPSYILYMQALYTSEVPTEIINEFVRMGNDNTLDKQYSLPILQAIFENENVYMEPAPLEEIIDSNQFDESEVTDLTALDLSYDTIRQLLELWITYNGMTHKYTDNILSRPRYISVISANPALTQTFFKYTGKRIIDADSNGVWEQRFTYEDGVLIDHEYDNNQDGIIEIKYSYNKQNGNLIKIEQNTDKLHKEFNINPGDQSVISCYVQPNDVTRQEYVITFRKSMYILDKKSSLEYQLMAKNYIKHIDDITYLLEVQKENEQHKHKKEIYVDGVLICTYFDNDNNGIYDEKQTYINGKISDRMRDIDEDGFYEITDFYENDRYVGLACKENEFSKNYYYREDFNGNKITKKWDTNEDGKYELNVTDVQKKQVAKADTGKYQIITSRKIEEVIYPKEIVVDDVNHNSGYYIHNGKKFLFKDGKITEHSYNLEVKSIGEKLYLFDLNN